MVVYCNEVDVVCSSSSLVKLLYHMVEVEHQLVSNYRLQTHI